MYKTTRKCKCCGKLFTPEHGRQVFCTPACRELYKKRSNRLRKKSVTSVKQITQIQSVLSNKELLSITEAAEYLGVSRPTVYARIKEGELVPVRVSIRTVRIPIEQLKRDSNRLPQPFKGDYSILITKEEALERYDVGLSWIYKRMKDEGIRTKIIKGKTYFPRKELDRFLPLRKHYNPDEWYDAAELMKREGLTRKYISYFIRRKGITCRRQGWTLLIHKESWDKAKLVRGDIEKNYLTVDQARKLYHIGQKTFYDGVHEAGLQGIREHNFMYYSKSELDRLFKDKTPKIPPEIRRNYIRSGDALKKYHIGQKRFSDETRAAGVTKVKTEGNYVWYKKSELDKLFKKISDQ